VCDAAAAETCPVFFGGPTGTAPVKVHWGYPDPSHAEGGDAGKARAFELTRQAIGYKMLQLLDLLEAVGSDHTPQDAPALKAALEQIALS
jgi:arsenate reductase